MNLVHMSSQTTFKLSKDGIPPTRHLTTRPEVTNFLEQYFRILKPHPFTTPQNTASLPKLCIKSNAKSVTVNVYVKRM